MDRAASPSQATTLRAWIHEWPPNCSQTLPTPPPGPRRTGRQLRKIPNTSDSAGQRRGALTCSRLPCLEPMPAIKPACSAGRPSLSAPKPATKPSPDLPGTAWATPSTISATWPRPPPATNGRSTCTGNPATAPQKPTPSPILATPARPPRTRAGPAGVAAGTGHTREPAAPRRRPGPRQAHQHNRPRLPDPVRIGRAARTREHHCRTGRITCGEVSPARSPSWTMDVARSSSGSGRVDASLCKTRRCAGSLPLRARPSTAAAGR
jgi:hypothetical protein